MLEIGFYKERNKDQKPNETINIEEFIAVKGINALGNQLYSEKLKQLNLLEPLPFEIPEEEVLVTKKLEESNTKIDDDGTEDIDGDFSQGSLF